MLIGLFICLFIIYLFLIMPAFDRRCAKDFRRKLTGKRRLIAHRGLHFADKVPENSLAAFSRAREAGYGIELDVRLTSDGVPVVFHDDGASRMCGADKLIKDMTFEEVKNLRLLGTEERIPTFQEALSVIGGAVPLLVEIKCTKFDNKLCEKTAVLLDTYPGEYIIESFHPMAVHWFQQNRRQIVRGQLVYSFSKEEKKKNFSYRLLEKLLLNLFSRPDFIAYPKSGYRSLALSLCAKAFGCMKFVWTASSLEEAEKLLGSADAVIFEKGSL